jgi:hypothetical protein
VKLPKIRYHRQAEVFFRILVPYLIVRKISKSTSFKK